ncbi:uncharacterized protein LOC121053193 [Oryza brachyantha]|uniref:Uncharacterized protein n=1 Tax=Oryza brachyantha TaxID=4533 RepID=J3LVA5_ORYBR|nr:uncharacterized protein LOC121053193 [Oryza brachyantha]XP_040379641.1 uncharacterized protein LOC121053193 [Oryza brachyantha]
MASADAILSSQVAGECMKITKLAAASPAKVQVQSEDGIGSRRQQVVKMEKAVSKQLKPRFALELDGLYCFETLVPR